MTLTTRDEPSGSTAQLNFHVQGMCCSSEANALRKVVGPLVDDPDTNVVCDVVGGRLLLRDVRHGVGPESVIRAVRSIGLDARHAPVDASPSASRANANAPDPAWRRSLLLAGLSGAWLLVGLALVWLLPEAVGAHRVALALAALSGCALAAPKAWGALRHLRPDMNLLMTVAVAGAVAIGEWVEAGTVAFLFAVALALETWSVRRARRAVAALMTVAPDTARVESDGVAGTELPVEQVPVGAVVVVRPGERLPLDGEVITGAGHVNQAPITGESVPVLREAGDEVFAGSINGESALRIRTTREAGDTTLARTLRIVQDAQAKRAQVDRWVDRFARVYTPVVMGIALAIAVLPPLLVAADWTTWIYRALVMLVIACPCALVISTPVSIVAAMAAAAGRGVLIKGGVFLEQAAHLRAMAFDKTGTLTLGRPAVAEVVALTGRDVDALALAAAVGAGSEHPLAQAIHRHAVETGVTVPPADGVTAVPGRGATARVNGADAWLGSPRYVEERGLLTDELRRRIDAVVADGRTVVLAGTDDTVDALVALTDPLRDETAPALAGLRDAGLHLAVLTGDHEPAARRVAAAAGIDDVRSGLLPADKVAAVEELVARYHPVAMVGDGINDAPAMARAHMGIAMGAAGTDAAIETADIALMTDNLQRLPWLVRHARRTLATVRQNIALALGLKVVVAAATLVGYVALWAAIAADVGASLLVVLNGLRLLRARG